MATGTPVQIGPFTGGLNVLEDPRNIQDDQLQVCKNVDIGRDGSLTTRTGLRIIQTAFATAQVPLDSALLPSGVSRFFKRDTANTIQYKDGAAIIDSAIAWTGLGTAAAERTEKAVQYAGFMYFIPKGGTAVGVSHNLSTAVSASITGMPKGTSAVVFKDRLFIFGPVDGNNTPTQRVYYSAATDFTNWPATNFFDIVPGDGEGVVAAAVANDTLVFFKRHSTFALFYDIDPGLGTLRRVNSEIGATGPKGVVSHENTLYLISDRSIYRIQNFLFDDIGSNVNLPGQRINLTNAFEDSAIVLGNKLMFIVNTSGTNFKYFVYHPDLEAWSTYDFLQKPRDFKPVNVAAGFPELVTFGGDLLNFLIFSPYRTDAAAYGDYPGGVTDVAIISKKFSYAEFGTFKRMFWWGVEAAINTGSITLQMWVTPTNIGEATITSTGEDVKFYKSFKTSRFRFLEYRILASAASQRIKILQGTAYVAGKTEVSKNVTG